MPAAHSCFIIHFLKKKKKSQTVGGGTYTYLKVDWQWNGQILEQTLLEVSAKHWITLRLKLRLLEAQVDDYGHSTVNDMVLHWIKWSDFFSWWLQTIVRCVALIIISSKFKIHNYSLSIYFVEAVVYLSPSSLTCLSGKPDMKPN